MSLFPDMVSLLGSVSMRARVRRTQDILVRCDVMDALGKKIRYFQNALDGRVFLQCWSTITTTRPSTSIAL
jgi:hypothetical protein